MLTVDPVPCSLREARARIALVVERDEPTCGIAPEMEALVEEDRGQLDEVHRERILDEHDSTSEWTTGACDRVRRTPKRSERDLARLGDHVGVRVRLEPREEVEGRDNALSPSVHHLKSSDASLGRKRSVSTAELSLGLEASGSLVRPIMRLDKQYIASLHASVAANAGPIPNQRAYEATEWEARIVRCSRRLLSAIVFREMAQVTLETTRSPLLPVVGFYYVLFHAGVAMLTVDHATPLSEVAYTAVKGNPNEPAVTHKKVRKLLKANLIEKGVLDASFIKNLDVMKKRREHVNYAVGGRLPGDLEIETLDEAALYGEVGASLDLAVSFVKEVAARVDLDADTSGLSRIQSTIGDHFGDDLIHLYVPRDYRERVWGYLTMHELTN